MTKTNKPNPAAYSQDDEQAKKKKKKKPVMKKPSGKKGY